MAHPRNMRRPGAAMVEPCLRSTPQRADDHRHSATSPARRPSMSTHRRPGPNTPATPKRTLEDQVRSALTWLKRHRTRATLEGMARYSIPSDRAYGVAMKDIKAL